MNTEIPSSEIALCATPERLPLEEGPALVLLNPNARMGHEAMEAALSQLANRQVAVLASHKLTDHEHMERLLQDGLAQGVRRFIVGGGDGTLNHAVKHLLGHDVTLGVLPLGTGNDFARSLGIEPTLEAACDAIAEGFTVRVDVGLANGHPFLNAVSLGLASAIAKRLTPELKRRVGKLAYPVAAFAELWEHQPFRVILSTDDETLEMDVLQLVVGNGRYHGAGNMVTPDATLDDQRLDAYGIIAPSHEAGREGTNLGHMQDLSTLARVAMTLRSGEHLSHPAVKAVSGPRIRVDATPPQDVNADGEMIGQTPVRFELLPGALRVYAPRHPAPETAEAPVTPDA